MLLERAECLLFAGTSSSRRGRFEEWLEHVVGVDEYLTQPQTDAPIGVRRACRFAHGWVDGSRSFKINRSSAAGSMPATRHQSQALV
jgi:hypothetical protein